MFRKLLLSSFVLLVLTNAFCQSKTSFKKESRRTKFEKTDQIDIAKRIYQAKAIKEKSPVKALDYLEQALLASKQQGETFYEAECYFLIGEINQSNEQWDLAIENFLKAKNLLSLKSGKNLLQNCRFQIAESYKAKSSFLNAKTYYQSYSKDASTENERFKANTGLGDLYYQFKKYDLALSFF